MPAPDRFTLHPDSTLLRPEAPGLAELCACLASGQSVWARQTGPPVTARADRVQKLYCQSSGTSGVPKTVRRSPASWIASFELHRTRFVLGPDDTYATLGPLGHSLSLFASMEALHLGADLLALQGLSPRRQAREIASHEATVLYTTPTQLRLLTQGAARAGLGALPALRHVLCGGGALDPAQRPALNALCPNARLRVFYGASETSFIAMEDGATSQGAVGRPYPGVRLEIRRDGHALPQGETGEIWVKSPYLFEGYETGQSAETRWQGGWLSVGEMGYLDPEGQLVLRGRKARMVQVADQTVFPDEIEAVLAADPAVRACAVIALPDTLRGTRLVCVIEADPAPALEARLRAACRARLGPASVPRRFVLTETLPLLPAGKPDLRRLQSLIATTA